MNVTVTLDGRETFSREVDSFECEESAGGTFTARATFPFVEDRIDTPTGTVLDGAISNTDWADEYLTSVIGRSKILHWLFGRP